MKPDLDAIRKREQAATAGPWEAVKQGDQRGNPSPIYTGLVCILEAGENGVSVVAESEWVPKEDWHPNADFIAHAREDVPALLAEVERLTVERDALIMQRDGTAAGRDWHIDNAAELLARATAAETALAEAKAENERLREALTLFRKAKASVAADAYDGVDQIAREMLETADSLAGYALAQKG